MLRGPIITIILIANRHEVLNCSQSNRKLIRTRRVRIKKVIVYHDNYIILLISVEWSFVTAIYETPM